MSRMEADAITPAQAGPAQITPAQTTSAQMSRIQLIVVVAGYIAAVLISAALLYMRHLQYVKCANDVDASGGMWAFGDLMLEFIAGLLLIRPFCSLSYTKV